MEARADSPEPLGGEGLEGAGGDAAAAPPPGGVLRRAWRGVRNWFRGGEEHFEPMNGGINPMFKCGAAAAGEAGLLMAACATGRRRRPAELQQPARPRLHLAWAALRPSPLAPPAHLHAPRRTYIYPGEDLSRRRYLAAVVVVLAGFLWWLGPVLGLFVVDPLIQLQVSNMQVRRRSKGQGRAGATRGARGPAAAPLRSALHRCRTPRLPLPLPPPPPPAAHRRCAQVITPRTDCFDHKASDQDCDDQVGGPRSRGRWGCRSGASGARVMPERARVHPPPTLPITPSLTSPSIHLCPLQGVTHFYYFYNITNPAEVGGQVECWGRAAGVLKQTALVLPPRCRACRPALLPPLPGILAPCSLTPTTRLPARRSPRSARGSGWRAASRRPMPRWAPTPSNPGRSGTTSPSASAGPRWVDPGRWALGAAACYALRAVCWAGCRVEPAAGGHAQLGTLAWPLAWPAAPALPSHPSA